MPSLDALAGWENAVLASVHGARGTLEERDRQIERSGLYGEYPEILRAYRSRLDVPEERAESLKRAVFLVWYACVEPRCLTGIGELPEADARAVMAALDLDARAGALDAEMRWMLAWYAARFAPAFDLYGGTDALRAVDDVPAEAWRAAPVAPGQWRGRGQLGHYWATVMAPPAA